MTTPEAKDLIIKEYPFLASSKLEIQRQYVLSDGRVTNTFLVTSSKKGFEKFIAKSNVIRSEDKTFAETLEKEWLTLNLLKDGGIAPKLLVPDHKPDRFLLIEYIEGLVVTEAIEKGRDINEIFIKMGETSGKINSVELETFGDILNPSDISWKDYFSKRLENGYSVIKQNLEGVEFGKAMKMIDVLKYVLEEETNKKPYLIHHDFYLDNYIMKENGDMVLLDYGIVFAGRPLFDLGKFYIWTLANYPDQKDNFLNSYFKYVEKPNNFEDIIKLYIIKELFGMIDFFTIIKEEKMKKETLVTLKEFINGKGKLHALFS